MTAQLFKFSRSLTTRAALLFSVALALAVPSLKAQTSAQVTTCQNDLNAKIAAIQPGKTILSCSASTLATAVAEAIKTNTTPSLLPSYYAVGALRVYPWPTGNARADRNTSAAIVGAAAVGQLLATGTDTNFNVDASEIAYGLMSVGGTNSADNLNFAGQPAVASAVIGTISDAYVAGTTGISKASLLLADRAIGISTSADTLLESASGKALVVIDEGALAGVNGTHGTSTAAAALAAQSFVEGTVLTGTVPDAGQGETSNTYAVALLSNTNINVNSTLDEYVANAIAVKDNSANVTSLESLATILIEQYSSVPGAVTKMSQGIAAAITPGTSGANRESNRVAFAQSLVNSFPGAAGVDVLEGMVYVDPFYAGGPNGFTYGVFSTLYAKSPSDLSADAPSIATGVGQVLGQDGNVLTQVASTFSTFIGAGKLPVASTATYAVDLISGAKNSPVLASEFTGAAAGAGGGQLNLSTPVTQTVIDLSAITDVLADGVITDYNRLGTLNTDATTVASQIGAIAENVANFTGNEAFTDTQNSHLSGSVAVYLAATLADYIASLNLTDATKTDILDDIKSDVEAVVTNSTYDTEITNQVNAAGSGSIFAESNYGAITVQETAVTNL
jgi:hypothetical protein